MIFLNGNSAFYSAFATVKCAAQSIQIIPAFLTEEKRKPLCPGRPLFY